jgi:hypothetical protein
MGVYNLQPGFPSSITKVLFAAQAREMKGVKRKFDFFNRLDAAKREKAAVSGPVDSASPVEQGFPSDMTWMTKMFPTIRQPALILKIVRNEFEPIQLARLSPRRCWDDFVGGCSSGDYPTLQSLLTPLSMYFRVLQAWVAASGDAEATRVVGESALRYTVHLLEFAETYPWPAVVQYHLQFHERRQRDMKRGDYSQWAVGDSELIHRVLVDQRNFPGERRPLAVSCRNV